MSDDRMALLEAVPRADDGNVLRALAESVLQLIMEADVEGVIAADRLLLISAANIGPNRFHRSRIVSELMSMPRSWSRSSTCRNDSGKRTYIMTARLMISSEVLKLRNGFLLHRRYENRPTGSGRYRLKRPMEPLPVRSRGLA